MDGAFRAGRCLAEILDNYRALVQARDLAGACREIDAAIDICPGSADLLQLRSGIWRTLGDYVRAAADHAAGRAIDPHFHDADRIRKGVQQVTDWFLSDRVADPAWLPDAVSLAGLRAVLEARQRDLARRRARLEYPSCDLPCPSQCCYFEDEPHAYGVHVAPSSVGEVRAWLEANGLREDECLARQPEAACAPAARDHPEWFAEDGDGGRWLWYPRLSDRPAPDLRPGAWPKNRDYRDLGWLTRSARGCRFVGSGGCGIHDVGSPAGMPACRSFLCFTAFVFVVLRTLGVCDRDELTTWSIEGLHRAAAPALLALAAMVADEGDLAGADRAAREALSRAVEADRRSDAPAAEASLSEFERACRVADATNDDRLRRVRGLLTQHRTEDCHE